MTMPGPLQRAIETTPPLSDATPQELAQLSDWVAQMGPVLLLALRHGRAIIEINVAEFNLSYIQYRPAIRAYYPKLIKP
jgi:hypothetical protein